MFSFEAGGTLQGIAGTASAITVTVSGVSVSAAGVEAPIGLLYQGQLPNAAGVLFTVPAGQSWIVKTINITNATGSSVAGVQLFQNGAAAPNSLIGPITMSGHYTLTGSENGWAMTDAAGVLQISSSGGGGGTVTSVGLSAPAEFTVSGSPVTGSGTLTFAKANQSINTVYAGPNSGSPGAPSFRTLVPADLPVATTLALGAVQPDGTTITISGGIISAAGALTQITKTVLGAPAASFSFGSISGAYSSLRLVIVGASSSASEDGIALQFNADTGSNYDTGGVFNNASSAGGFSLAAQTKWSSGAIVPPSSATSRASMSIIELPLYASTAFFKQLLCTQQGWISASTFIQTVAVGGDWKSTSAITSILVFLTSGSNFITGSTAILYGVS